MNVYFRSACPEGSKLSKVEVDNPEDHCKAIKAVMEHLHETQEVFYKPVLAVIDGGRHE